MEAKKTLIVIDMQNDFIDQALGTKEAVAIIPRALERSKSTRKGAIRLSLHWILTQSPILIHLRERNCL